jgi:hypothetical protein
MFIPLGITSSWTRNPQEEWDSARNYQLIDAYSEWNDQNVGEILRMVTIPGSAAPNSLYTTNANFPMKSKKDSKIS